MDEDVVIARLKKWSDKNEGIRALVLTGSRAEKGKSDLLSDYDIAVFSRSSSIFTDSESWLAELATPWVCVHEELSWEKEKVPTRLVVFEGGVKVDFAFYPLQTLQRPPKDLLIERKVLVDKDQLLQDFPIASCDVFRFQKPTKEDFLRAVEEFWSEVYHVAKYLARGDLWSAEFRSHGLKQEFLLKMICWSELAEHNWDYFMHSQGKRMHEWVDAETWEALEECSSRFNVEEGWVALYSTVVLFRRLAKETAELIGRPYPKKLDKNISGYIKLLHPNQK